MTKALFSLVLHIGVAFLSVFTFWCIWGWFVVPLGMPDITFAHAYGLSLVFSIIAFYQMINLSKTRTTEEDITLAAVKAVMYLFALAMGAIAHWFMVQS